MNGEVLYEPSAAEHQQNTMSTSKLWCRGITMKRDAGNWTDWLEKLLLTWS